MKITLLNGRPFDYQAFCGFPIKVITSAKAKRLTLRIDEKIHLPILTLPRRCSVAKAKEFLALHRDWIINMMGRLPRAQTFCSGDEIIFFGETYRIIHCPQNRYTVLVNNTLQISGDSEFLHRRTIDFLKKQTLNRLTDMTLQKAASIEKKVSSVTIKDTKSRWGSCSTLGNINYNWRICMAPPEVIDYLVCHEVSHLKHPNHSSAFWQCVEKLCPHYQAHRLWLKKHGRSLYKYI